MGLVAPRHVGSSRTRGDLPMSPALAGGFLTTEPPGKPHCMISNPLNLLKCALWPRMWYILVTVPRVFEKNVLLDE